MYNNSEVSSIATFSGPSVKLMLEEGPIEKCSKREKYGVEPHLPSYRSVSVDRAGRHTGEIPLLSLGKLD